MVCLNGAELDHRGSSQALQLPGGLGWGEALAVGLLLRLKLGLGFSSQPVKSTQTSVAV